jgi:hypothetical protein
VSIFSVRAATLITVALMQGCISEQQYRLDQQASADTRAEADAAHAAALQAAADDADQRVRIAAADAAAETAQRVAVAHKDALTLHRQQTAADAQALVDAGRAASTAEVLAVRAALDAHLIEGLRHDIQTAETLRGYQGRLEALQGQLVANLADDLNDVDRRAAAMERLTVAEVKVARGELDVIDLRKKLGSAEDKTDAAKADASDANTKAVVTAVMAFLAVAGGVLNEWRKARAAKKAGA